MQTIPPPGTAAPQGGGRPGRPAAPAQPPAAARSRSVMGRLVLSVAVFAVGLVGLIDIAGARVPVSPYFAIPLAAVAAGQILGSWYGRARGLIGFGVVLSLLLMIAIAAEGDGTSRSVTWQPAGVEQLQSTYHIGTGNAVLDLSHLNFNGYSKTLDVTVSVGNLDIVLPSTVDVEVLSTVGVGNATVLGERWGGVSQSERTIADTGPDGPGGGMLTITAKVNVGDLEVRR
jgi:hypothetical protein